MAKTIEEYFDSSALESLPWRVAGRDGYACTCCGGPVYEDPAYPRSVCESDDCKDNGSRMVSCPRTACHGHLMCRSYFQLQPNEEPMQRTCPVCRWRLGPAPHLAVEPEGIVGG